VREGTGANQLKLYVDGVLKVTGTNAGDYASYPWVLNIGGLNLSLNATGIQSGPFSFQDFRVSNIARYTGEFTPPTSQFVNDAYTKCLYHFNDSVYKIIDDASPYN
jgi:hypothetical protein